MVSHLLNVDEDLAKKVADGLRLKEMPKAAEPARPVVTDLQPSPALSILGNPPGTFKGRKLGVLVSDGVDADLLQAVQAAFKQEGAVVKLVAPMVGGVEASDGSWIAADEKIDGGPSVVFDAVAVLLSDAGAQLLAEEATARDFVADAFAHCKFIGHTRRRCRCWRKPGLPRRATAASLHSADLPTRPAFLKRAVSFDCGNAKRRSSAFNPAAIGACSTQACLYRSGRFAGAIEDNAAGRISPRVIPIRWNRVRALYQAE